MGAGGGGGGGGGGGDTSLVAPGHVPLSLAQSLTHPLSHSG